MPILAGVTVKWPRDWSEGHPSSMQVYYRGYDQKWSRDWCAQYTHATEFDNCIYWSTNTMRTLFFVLGFFGERVLMVISFTVASPCVAVGVVLLYRGFASFFASRHNN